MESRNIDRRRMFARKKFQFKPFQTKKSVPLSSAKIQPDEDLLVFERNSNRFALILRQMVYHHVAQGEIHGEPYLVSF